MPAQQNAERSLAEEAEHRQAALHCRAMRVLFRRSTLLILLLWAAITAIGFQKAFHIDDTFQLEAAQWIAGHPGRPMSGLVNWANSPEPIRNFNQPPGFFYLVAFSGHCFGWTERPMHALQSLFALLALACFYRLARHRAPRHALWATALFACCPAFMVNQGVMTDVPLLAIVLLFFTLLLVPGRPGRGPRYAMAALALSGALFIKYTALPLLLVFPLVLALKRERRWLPLTLIPLVFLGGWSIWNLHEFRGMHLLERMGGDLSARGIYVRTLALLTCIGAVAPFTPVFLRAFVRGRARWLLPAWLAGCALFTAFAAAVHASLLGSAATDQVLRITFTLNGLFLVVLCLRYLPRSLARGAADNGALAAWAGGFAVFIALFAPMMATRHVLQLIPPVLLLTVSALDRARLGEKVLAVLTTAVLGTLLALSDRAYAGFYRDQAPRIAHILRAETSGSVWSLGHWGWQWYAEHAGMKTYSRAGSKVAAGDILVIPKEYSAQLLAEGISKVPIATWKGIPGPCSFFSVDHYAGLYASSYAKLPWSLGREDHRAITAYRVTAVR